MSDTMQRAVVERLTGARQTTRLGQSIRPRQRPTVADRLLGAIRRPDGTLDEVAGEHMPCPAVAAVLDVLAVPAQGGGVDREHRVDGWVHQVEPPAFGR